MKILAVDDDNAVRISLNVMFRKWNDIELEVAEDAISLAVPLLDVFLNCFCSIGLVISCRDLLKSLND